MEYWMLCKLSFVLLHCCAQFIWPLLLVEALRLNVVLSSRPDREFLDPLQSYETVICRSTEM